MQTLTKRKESIVKQLSKSDSLFFQLEVEHLFSEEKEVVSFFEKEDEKRVSELNYDRKPKFLDCILRYQAREDVVIDKQPYEKYLSRHYGDLTKVTKKQLFLMLTRLGREDQVENLHLIHHEVTGVPPTNIRHLEPVLMRDFEILMRLFKDRKGVVSVRTVFYHLLKKNGVPCCKEEFGLRKEDKFLGELLSEHPPSTTSSNDRYRS